MFFDGQLGIERLGVRPVFDSLDDDNKALIKVDKDGLSIDDAEENEYQRVY